MKKMSFIDKATYIVVGIVLLLATFAICVGLGIISIGQSGINFSF